MNNKLLKFDIITKTITFLLFVILLVITASAKNGEKNIYPGKVWLDSTGNPINAHGGGVLFHGGIYYWFGENKDFKNWRIEKMVEGLTYEVNAGGVNCYTSSNLIDWTYEGLALAPDTTNILHDLHESKVLERPKVIYNESTKKFVMWLHVDSRDYSYSHAGVAIADKPQGPYTYIGSMRPNGQMSRDMTLFKDDNGKAYHIYSSEVNKTLHISLLSDDYLRPSGFYTRNFINKYREAPAVFKRKNKYYLISSGCTGWNPNQAQYAMADSMLGQWVVMGDTCVNDTLGTTFNTQSTFVLPVQGKKGKYIYMSDRWNKTDLPDSRYVWLPLNFINNKVQIEWKDSWNPSKN
ncbi:MAG: glycoside hydrolase family 43 protein [Prolixibacteraceae bacterium]